MLLNKSNSGPSWDNAIKCAVFCALVYFPIFLHVDTLPIRLYDESRLALNAYEMQRDGDLLVTHYRGQPDMWNTKPPLLIWLQALCMKVFGVNELSVRLPSALAAFFTCLVLLVVSWRYLKDLWFGIVSAGVLVTADGYINFHVSRTGDYDAMLVFFITAFSFFFFAFAETGKRKYLHLFFVALCLSILTKSVQPLMLLPALFLYLIITGKLGLLRNRWVIYDTLLVITVVAVYYLTREQYNPGYLQAVWNNELGGRYLEVNEGHQEKFLFYLENIVTDGFAGWFWLMPLGAIMGWFSGNERIRRVTLLSLLAAVTYWLLVSSAQTKLYWYGAPLYPFMAILAGMPLYLAIRWALQANEMRSRFIYHLTPFMLAFMVFLQPYQRIIQKVYFPKEGWDAEIYGVSHYLQEALRSEHDVNGYRILCDGYAAHMEFYINQLRDKGIDVAIADWSELKGGQTVLVSQTSMRKRIEDNYSNEVVENRWPIFLYRIHGEHARSTSGQ